VTRPTLILRVTNFRLQVPDRSYDVFRSVLAAGWSNTSLDDAMTFALRNIADAIRDVALASGKNVSHVAKYVNYYALPVSGTRPLEDMHQEKPPQHSEH